MGGYSSSHVLLAAMLIAATAGACWFLTLKLRQRRYRELSALITQGDASRFTSLLNSAATKMTLSPFAREYLRLRMLGQTGSDDDVWKQLRVLDGLQLKPGQRARVLTTGFELLARRHDKQHCGQLLEEIEKETTGEAAYPYRLYFDTVLMHKTIHREELEKKLNSLSRGKAPKTRGYVEYLLSQVESARGKHARALSLRRQSAQDYGVAVDDLDRSADVALYI